MQMQAHQDALNEILNRLDGISADLTEMKMAKPSADPEMGEGMEQEASEAPAFENGEDAAGGMGMDSEDAAPEAAPEMESEEAPEDEEEDPKEKLKKIFGK